MVLASGLLANGTAQAQQAASEVGQWGPVMNWPIVAVHAALLPNGRVFFFPYGDDPRLYDPVTGNITNLPRAGFNIFCTAHSYLPDGRLLFTGGHVQNGWGLPDTSIYDPFRNSWTRQPVMNNGRWYPTNVTLSNGEVLVVSGSYDVNYSNNRLPQVWTGRGWRNLTGAQLSLDLYPSLHLAPNGKVFLAGPGQTTRYLDTNGTGVWSTVAQRNFPYRGYGMSVMYEPGKVLFVGGGDPPTETAEVIDLNAATPRWRTVGPMAGKRRQIHATLLADGSVLVTGGTEGAGFNNKSTPVYRAEIWNPATEQFRVVAPMSRPRWYHSTALLLLDGRVLVAGGDDHPTAQIYSPPYLFRGARPVISSAPQRIVYGRSFTVGTPNASSIQRALIIRLGSVTHSVNMDQRLNRLNFVRGNNSLTLTAPMNANVCPPGYYMLFLINHNGVPSVASVIQVGGETETPIPALRYKINFQPTNAQVPAGYLPDDGSPFGNRGNNLTYGWNIDNRAHTRDRNAANSPDQRYDTLNHMQKNGSDARWELAVPNGRYTVRIVVGDPNHWDSVYKTNVENVLAINATPTSNQRWFENTVTVGVFDGRLTISNANGAKNNKICFIEIERR
jgi:hypothetical protein